MSRKGSLSPKAKQVQGRPMGKRKHHKKRLRKQIKQKLKEEL